jgi:hypothetical protein
MYSKFGVFFPYIFLMSMTFNIWEDIRSHAGSARIDVKVRSVSLSLVESLKEPSINLERKFLPIVEINCG